MAKVSAVERNLKRQRLVAKYAAKRALLKDIARNKDLPVEERFAAQLKLAELPVSYTHLTLPTIYSV